MAKITKSRYWWAVLYPENMVEGWQDRIADTVQVPYAYCIHDKDRDSKSEHRKDHLHLIIVFKNTTTYDHAMNVFGLLSAEGKNALNKCEACVNIRHCYDYLIHDTQGCKKAGKELYSADDRIEGNNFDIGDYEQMSQADKDDMLKEMCDFIMQRRISNMADFYIMFSMEFSDDYFPILKSNNAFIDRLTRGNYLKYCEKEAPSQAQHHASTTENEAICCPECGSVNFKKRGKTASDQQRYECKDCGKTFV